MTAQRPGEPPLPEYMKHLPRDRRGYIIPWFVPIIEGQPDFQHIQWQRVQQAIRQERCWVCGGGLHKNRTFVVGPMCVVNCVTSEPPNHVECAEWSVKACPFLSRPRMRRMPMTEEEERSVPGIMLERNPGVSAVWVVRRYTPFRPENGGTLFRIDPRSTVRISCWAEGRPATQAETEESVRTGLPFLQEMAVKDDEHNGDTSASEQLAALIAQGRKLLGLPPQPVVEGQAA